MSGRHIIRRVAPAAPPPPAPRAAPAGRGLPAGRLKTGTPPRIDGRSIDYSLMLEQPGDDPVPVFSFMGNAAQHPQQLPCWITETNQCTHDIIRGGLDRSPLFTGVIEGVGDRKSTRLISTHSSISSTLFSF